MTDLLPLKDDFHRTLGRIVLAMQAHRYGRARQLISSALKRFQGKQEALLYAEALQRFHDVLPLFAKIKKEDR